jgi:hypothetical protein
VSGGQDRDRFPDRRHGRLGARMLAFMREVDVVAGNVSVDVGGYEA